MPNDPDPDVLRASTEADFLALVPRIAGFRPTRSVVCVPFAGRRTAGGAMRLDLPIRGRRADLRRLTDAVVHAMSRLAGVDRVDFVVYTDAAFADERGIPWLDGARQLRTVLERAGFRVGAALCVARDGWGSYLERAHRDEGRPLWEIDANRLAADEPLERPEAAADLPAIAPRRRAAFAKVRRELELALDSGENSPLLAFLEQRPVDPVSTAERCITSSSPSLLDLAWLAEVIASPVHRDVVMLQWAFGRETGARLHASGLFYAELQRRTGRSMDEIVAHELAVDDTADDDGRLLLGLTERVPDRERMQRGVELLRELLALAPDGPTSAAGCMLAWLLWGLGRGTAASTAIGRVLERDPGYGMANVLGSVFAAGMWPNWIFVREPPTVAPPDAATA